MSEIAADKPPVERHRPRWHFTPPVHWLNDPNALFHDGHRYRLCFQYCDDAPQYRRAGWGVASSADLVRWRFEGHAIEPSADAFAYSGSVIAPDAVRRIAFFTEHRRLAGGTANQSQHRAVSGDGGRTFRRDPDRAVIDRKLANFRDPFVFRHEPSSRWIMLIARPADWNDWHGETRSSIVVFASEDLLDWHEVGLIGPWDPPGIMWEVPVLVRLADPRGSGRWVLLLSTIDRREDRIECAVRYHVGEFDGATFRPDAPLPAESRDVQGVPLDFGPDYYAAIPAVGRPGDPTVIVAWLSSWAYARRLPVRPWAGGPLACPRTLELEEDEGRCRLVQRPVAAVATLRGEEVALDAVSIGVEAREIDPRVRGRCFELACDVDLAAAEAVELRFLDETVALTITRSQMRLDRASAGGASLGEQFAATTRAPLAAADGRVHLRVLVDECCFEIFADHGRTTLSALAFAPSDAARISARAVGGAASLRSLTFWPLAPRTDDA